MNVLLIQFLVVAIFPLSLVAMMIYAWRFRPENSRPSIWWIVTLAGIALWMTRLLPPYFGREVNILVGYYWRVIANYPLSILGSLFLLTTTNYLNLPFKRHKWVYVLGAIFTATALILDPALWSFNLPDLNVSGLSVKHFDMWALFWILGLIIPSLIAWVISEQSLRKVPQSLYRNQAAFWFVTITVGLVGAILGLLRDSLGGQQIGAILLIGSGVLGTLTITSEQLPNMRRLLGAILFQLLRGVIVFALMAGAIYFLVQIIVDSPDQQTILIVSATLFGLMIVFVNRWLNRLETNYRARRTAHKIGETQEQLESIGNLLNPANIAAQYLSLIEARLQPERAWIMMVEDAPAGTLILRPLSTVRHMNAVSFPAENAFNLYLQSNKTPLTIHDVNRLNQFSDMPLVEQSMIEQWKCQLFAPVHHADQLVALIGLRAKRSAEQYEHADFEFLQALAPRLGMLLIQSQNVHALEQISDNVYIQNRALAQEGRRLKELVHLYEQFAELLSPELRRPFTQLEIELQQFESRLIEIEESRTVEGGLPALAGEQPSSLRAGSDFSLPIATLREQVDESQAMIDNLISIASHLEKQSDFRFETLYIDAILRSVVFNLQSMSEARRVSVEFEVRGKLLPVIGDESRLIEAFHQLLHNALKFNRIGGVVQISAQMVRNEVLVQIVDYGVGIPPNRLGDLWSGLTKLFGHDRKGARRRTRIGLPLVRFIVQSHGGRVEARSTYGKGSTFSVFLPAFLSEEEEALAE